jgi:hypothetical protein
MLYGAFSYTLVDETSEAPILDKALADTTQMVGFLDKDMDGKLSWQELPGSIKKRLVQGFKMVDTNADGGLDIQELYSLSKRGQQAQSNDASTEAGGG